MSTGTPAQQRFCNANATMYVQLAGAVIVIVVIAVLIALHDVSEGQGLPLIAALAGAHVGVVATKTTH